MILKRKKMLLLTKEELKSHQDPKVCYICGKRILKKFDKDQNYQKVRDDCHYAGKYRGAAHSICNLKFNMPNEIPVVFHNGPNYDYYFIIKELANEFEGQFECLNLKVLPEKEALPEKEEFYSNLNLEDITDADYMHGKRVCKHF